ncbi:MAG: hypothetical protein EDM79_07085 [Chloroflexi bacterium]|nr:MAG: hypothetical protein EDM79_07085 [Chloroflexota bacterium]
MSPDKQTEPKPTVTKDSSEFNKDVYASIPPGELVVFAVQVLQADGSPAATEDIVSICFRFFPHSFSLKNYFYWPDSALVTRRLHDAKEKGLLKGNAADGFEVKVQGRRVAKHVAKALGVVFPAPPKVEVPPAPVEEKKEEPKAPARAEEKVVATPVKPQKKKSAQGGRGKLQKKKKVVKKPPVKEIKQVKKPAVRKKPVVIKMAVVKKPKPKVVKPVVLKKKPAPKPKAGRKQAKLVKKVKAPVKPIAKVKSKPQPKKQAKAPKVKIQKQKPQKKQKQIAKQAKATQLTVPLAPPTAWKKAEVPAIKPKVKVEAPPIADKKPVKKEAAVPVVVSKEEKVKAAKVVKQIEHSDAYRSYRRSGRRAIIGEFDFRNMLFATMESSAETLKRNMDLFKRYAGIHFRADLIAFLDFCEEKFSVLLISKAKVKGGR